LPMLAEQVEVVIGVDTQVERVADSARARC
jgi:hypothetical protein